MATEYTPNYDLDLYASGDKANLRDQYNAAMGKIDTELKVLADGDTTLQNLIAGINREITTINQSIEQANNYIAQLQTLTGDQGDLISANKTAIAALQTTVDAHGDHLTTIDGEVATLTGDTQALTATVEAHGTAITGAQKTADDALSLAQTNESDIATAEADITINKRSIAATQVNEWDFSKVAIPVYCSGGNLARFINDAQTLFKVGGYIGFNENNFAALPIIPGSDNIRGLKLMEFPTAPPSNMTVYYGCGFYTSFSGSTLNAWGDCTLVRGTDGAIYVYTGLNAAPSTNRTRFYYLTQTPLTLIPYDQPAPEVENA